MHQRSCIACYRRKLKCDRSQTCSSCSSSGTACVYTDKPIRRHRKKKHSGQDLVERVADLELLARWANVQNRLSERVPEPSHEARDVVLPRYPGRLVVDKGGQSRLLTDTSWVHLSSEASIDPDVQGKHRACELLFH